MCRLAALKARQAIFGNFPETQQKSRKREQDFI